MNKPRYRLEQVMEIEQGCRCLCCWEYIDPPQWIVEDMLDIEADTIFSDEKEAERYLEKKLAEETSK